MVGILIRVDTHGRKPNDFILIIHMLNFANKPFPLSDWIDYLPCGRINSVEMIPSTPFTGPNQLLGLIDPMKHRFLGVIHKCLRRLPDKVSHFSGFAID